MDDFRPTYADAMAKRMLLLAIVIGAAVAVLTIAQQFAKAQDFRPLATAILVTSRVAAPAPAPTPGPAPAPSGQCENCNGTGRLGDGTISLPCPVCGGDGIKSALGPAAPVSAPAVAPAAAGGTGGIAYERRPVYGRFGRVVRYETVAIQQPAAQATRQPARRWRGGSCASGDCR